MPNRALRFFDVGLAVVAAAAVITEGSLRANGGLSPGACVLAIAAAAPLAWRTRAPLAALVGVEAGAILCAAALNAGWSATAMVIVELYTVARLGSRQRSLVIGGVTGIGVVVVIVLIEGSPELTAIGLRLLLVFAALAVGDTIRSRQALSAAARERAAREAREREEENLRRAAEERVRIARELHDTLAHSLVAINVRASVAVDLHDSQDPSAALKDIKQASATALRDLRTTLSLLREPDDEVPTAPACDLRSLPGLVEQARSAGLHADIDVDVEGAAVPSAIGGAAFRIVQEALTNVLRHADASSAHVERPRERGRAPRRRHRQRPRRHARASRPASASAACSNVPSPSADASTSAPSEEGGWTVHAMLPLSGRDRSMTPTSVVLAEDQPMVRAGFRALLDSRDDIEVVGEAATGAQALEQVRALNPDVVVMDIRMPEMDGLEATRASQPTRRSTGHACLVLTTFELDEYVFGALNAGASGFLLKGGEPADLIHAIRVVAAGEALLAPSVTRRLIDNYVTRPPAFSQDRPRRAGPAYDPRARSPRARRDRPDQRRNRSAASPQPTHRQNARLQDPDETRRARPSAARRHRLPDRNDRPTTELAVRIGRRLHD